MSHLEERWRAHIEKEGGMIPSLLRVVSWGYGAGMAIRNLAYDTKCLPIIPSPLKTISVGNLQVGGSGKTPLVHFLASQCLASQAKGKVAILSRGYGSRAEKKQTPTLVTSTSSWEEVGDEPLMLAKSLPNVLVIISADRIKGATFAKELGADLLFLDDGFQHRRLSRESDIVCIPASANFKLFPWGPSREPLSSLKRASLIAITECKDQIPPLLSETIARYTSAPQVGFKQTLKVVGQGGQALDIADKEVALFCGIARPERFQKGVEALGGIVTDTLFLKDHGEPSLDALEKLRKRGGLLLCTEKDWVKNPLADGYVQLKVTPLDLTNYKFNI